MPDEYGNLTEEETYGAAGGSPVSPNITQSERGREPTTTQQQPEQPDTQEREQEASASQSSRGETAASAPQPPDEEQPSQTNQPPLPEVIHPKGGRTDGTYYKFANEDIVFVPEGETPPPGFLPEADREERTAESKSGKAPSQVATLYFKTVDDWNNAGRPKGNDKRSVIIGTAPAGVAYTKPKPNVLVIGADTDNPAEVEITPELLAMKATNPRLFNILFLEGADAYNRAIAAESFATQQEFKHWIDNEAPAVLRDAYRRGGKAAYDKAVGEYRGEQVLSGMRSSGETVKQLQRNLEVNNRVLSQIVEADTRDTFGRGVIIKQLQREQEAVDRLVGAIDEEADFYLSGGRGKSPLAVPVNWEAISEAGVKSGVLDAPLRGNRLGWWSSLDDTQKREVAANYKPLGFAEQSGAVLGSMQTDLSNLQAKTVSSQRTYAGRAATSAGFGAAQFGLTLLGSPIMLAGLVTKKGVVGAGREVIGGTGDMVAQIIAKLINTPRGYGYKQDLSAGDFSRLVNDSLNLATIGLAGAEGVGLATRATQFAEIALRPDYVPLRSLSMEASTARVPFTASQLARIRKAGGTEADIIRAGTEITKRLVAGEKNVAIEVAGVKIAKIKNVPYQTEVKGFSLFHSTPDISLLDRGGEGSPIAAKDLYTASKAAIEPLKKSYLSGVRATKPGIAEIRISDPEIISEIAPQRRLISGGRVLEPEAPIPDLNALKGRGYRLEPIPGRAGRGVTFDASLGEVAIRRYTLSRVTDVETGLKPILGQAGKTGTVAIGDLHGTTNFRAVFDDVNNSFGKKVIEGNPNKPSSWHWVGDQEQIVILGDSIDRGPAYGVWRDTFNRLSKEATATGGRVERLLGNHELAYLADDAISGIKYTDKFRKTIKSGLKEDIKAGRVKAAYSDGEALYTHAGVSLGQFRGYKGKTPGYVAADLNKKFTKAVESNNYGGKLFAKGRLEKGHSLSRNEGSQGGIFWLRPSEAKASQLDLGFRQVVGHNPGFGVRRIWGKNFIEADVARRTGTRGVYANTPHLRLVDAEIQTEGLGGTAPKLNTITMYKLKAMAMRDSIADAFLGWDGRVQAVRNIRESAKASKALKASLDEQIRLRREAGDSIGVKFLKRQKSELFSPRGSDYLYGGIDFWRDIVMGRQNSVSALRGLSTLKKARLIPSSAGILNVISRRMSQISDVDTRAIFGASKVAIARNLDTKELRGLDEQALREALGTKLIYARDLVDTGLDRAIYPVLGEERVLAGYSGRLQAAIDDELESTRVPGEERTISAPEYERVADEPADDRPISEERTPASRTPRTPQDRVPIERVGRPVGGYRPVPPRNPDRTPTRVPPRTPATPPITVFPPTETPPPLAIGRLVTASPAGALIPEGSIAWKQGALWKYAPPPWDYDRVLTLPKGVFPHGARNTELRTPMETIQMIGQSRTARVPETIRVDLGITDALVSDSGNRIDFEGKGELTNVGMSLSSPTQGITVSDGAEAVDRARMTTDRSRTPAPVVTESELELMQTSPEQFFQERKGVYRPGMGKKKSNNRRLPNKTKPSYIVGGVRR